MKKTIIAMALCIASSTVFSQEVHWGLKAGVNFSNMETNGATELNSRMGFHGGGLAHIHMSDHFAIQPEVVYSNQGADIDELDSRYKFGYINVPVMFQYMFKNGFRIETGPQAGFLIKATRDDGNSESDIKDNINSFDFGWSFGLGYITKSRVGIDARYNLGISDLNENPSLKYQNRVFQVGLFYQFKHR